MDRGFAINRGVGFSIKFNNGVVVSVQFGPHHYCSNQGKDVLNDNHSKHGIEVDRYTCDNAEVAIFNDKGWLTKEFKYSDDDVLSHQSAASVLAALKWAEAYKEDK